MKVPKWAIVLVTVQLFLLGFLTYRTLRQTPVVNNIVHNLNPNYEKPKDGYTPQKNVDYFDGKDAVVDYEKIFNDITKKVSEIPKPLNGEAGKTPIKGVDYNDGKDGENGPQGNPGPRTEFRCRDFSNRPSQVQWKYEDIEVWTKLHDIATKCSIGS